ncbi:MAG: manganese efflux pump [Bacteroidaceae bacterium]|nr:manganese efflux pump [Bacteroidaceae bacterium]
MSAWEVWLLGIALAMDCFAVSIATGVLARRVMLWPMARQSVMFGLFQGGMMILGYGCMAQFQGYIEAYDHWIAFGLLAYLGLKMIYESFSEKKPSQKTKGMGRKKKEVLTMNTTVIMAIATSIDALTVGISMACLTDITLLLVCQYALIVALCSLVFSVAGLGIGIYGSQKGNWHIEAIGGAILLMIGIKILIEHTI